MFFKPPPNVPMKTEYAYQNNQSYANQVNQNYSYGGLNNPNIKSNPPAQNYNYGGSGMGVMNYNAYSQK